MIKLVVGIAFSLLLFHSTAMAACTVPNTLTNGTTADATAVMGNFTSLAGCAAPLASPSFTGTVTTSSVVGVGTASPSNAMLAVNGVAVVNGTNGAAGASANAKLVISGTPATISFGGSSASAKIDTPNGSSGSLTYDSGAHIFQINTSEKMRIISSGNVGIGTSSPSYTLHVNGSVAGTSAYNNLSDARLKKNVVPLTAGLALIAQLQPVRFDWRSVSERSVGKNFDLPAEKQIGFIAQDLNTVLPEAVSTAKGKDAIMSVAESKVVPILVAAVKELKAANDSQAAKIERLESQMAVLQRKVGVQAARN